MAYRNHRDLMVWKKSMLLAKKIYLLTQKFPKEETFGLVSQIQRSAVSIPSNIAEGGGRESDVDFDRFLKIATGSACELDTQVELAAMNNYISQDEKYSILNDLEEVLKLIYGLRKSLKSRINNASKH